MLNLQLFFIHSDNINKFVMHLIKGLDMLKKNIFILILLFIINLPLFLVIFILSIIPENKLLNIIIYTAIFYFSYLIILLTLEEINYKYNNKIFSKIYRIIKYPMDLLFNYGRFFFPILMGFQFSLFLYFAICNVIPTIISTAYSILHHSNINYEIYIYLYITIFVIISILFRTKILHIIFYFHLKIAFSTFSSKKITLYILSENNIKAIIYFSYFLLLILINIYNFNSIPLFKNVNIDKSILQSFATYIAFERFYNHLKKVNFRFPEFVNKILNAMISNLKNQ